MTLFIQTRCPQCYNRFDVPEEMLDLIDIKGRCGQCQQVFLINDHLVVSADRQPEGLENDVENNTGAFSQYGIKHLAGRGSYNFVSVVYKIVNHTVISVNSNAIIEAVEAAKKVDRRSKVKVAQHPVDTDLEPKVADSFVDDFDAWQTPLAKPATHKTDSKTNETDSNIKQLLGNKNKPSPASTSASIITSASDTDTSPTDSNPSPATALPSVTHLTHLLTNEDTVLGYQPSLRQHYNNQLSDRAQPIAVRSSASIATMIWLAGCLLLLLLLLAQYVIFNLNTLIKNPTHAARLQAICSIAVCGLPNADLSALSTAQLSMRASTINTNTDFSDLQAELINNSTQAQLLPNLKVSVYNADGLLGAFIAMPEDYLLSKQSQLAGEKSLSVMFTVPVSAQQINKFTVKPIY